MHKNITQVITYCSLLFGSMYAESVLAQGVVITSGANVVVNGNANLVIADGGLSNAGTFTPGTGTVTFTGTANSTITTIGGTSSLSFYNLAINKTGGSAKLVRNIGVTNNVTMTSGVLDVSAYNLDLGTTGNISGESTVAYITGGTGGVLRSVTLNAPSAVDPGNVGIEITSAANLGVTTIKRGHQQQVSASGYSIDRYFEITPANNTALNATVKFYYRDAELAGINESELKMWSSADNGVTWNLLGADAQDATNNFVTKSGIQQFNRITLASAVANPLPIQLMSFTAELFNSNVYLNWTTSFELNNHHFELEKSVDGRNFSSFAKVIAAGNATGTSHQYNYIDIKPLESGVLYYRLKQVNNDGSFTYSKTILINKGNLSNILVSAYPNPTSGPVHIRFVSDKAAKATLMVTDMKGHVVITKEILTLKGLNEFTQDFSRLAQGTYYVQLNGIDDKTLKVIKN